MSDGRGAERERFAVGCGNGADVLGKTARILGGLRGAGTRELPGLEEARYEAIAFAADTLKDDVYALWDGGKVRIEVKDSAQSLVFTIFISAVIGAKTLVG